MTMKILLLCAIAAAVVPLALGQKSDTWKLVWSDEFDRDGRPDPAKWTYETGFVRNQELQWYQPENAWCEHGMLIVEGRRERKKNPDFQPGSVNWKSNREYAEYTSASLTTKGIASWRYGRFDNACPHRYPGRPLAGVLDAGRGRTLAQ